ncbi:hypothetical protein JWF83_12065 [Pantoea sp. B65]
MTELTSGKKAHTSPPLLLASQFIFNTGFYAVVPFLALFLRDDMLLSGAAIGRVPSLRIFSQQGMFLVGGALTDRFGGRAIILCSCLIRISGYLLLATSASLWGVILGTCLTAIGGVAVLTGHFVLGELLDHALIPSSLAFVPWLMMACIPLCRAVAMLFILRTFKTTSANQ